MMSSQMISSWSEELTWVWLGALPRQAILVLAVALLVRSWPRLAAAWRHWLWLASALAVGLLPLAAVWLPQWPLIPAEWVYGEAVNAATPLEAEQLLIEAMSVGEGRAAFHLGWLEAWTLVWLGGVTVLTGRLVAGLAGLRSFQGGRLPVCTGRLCARLEYCRRLAGVTTLVDLYLSRRSPLPMTWGVLRPAINLPMEAEHWADERLDAVFLHELAHIHRADCWTNMVLKTVCALNWFNPLVWMAARRTYLAQEVACDDFACQKLRPSDYARHLLELTAVVKDFHRRQIEPAVGLSSCDHLRLRVAAALDPERSRRPLPSRIASLISSLVFLVMGGTAMVSLRFVEDSRAAPMAPRLSSSGVLAESPRSLQAAYPGCEPWESYGGESGLSTLTRQELGMNPPWRALKRVWGEVLLVLKSASGAWLSRSLERLLDQRQWSTPFRAGELWHFSHLGFRLGGGGPYRAPLGDGAAVDGGPSAGGGKSQ